MPSELLIRLTGGLALGVVVLAAVGANGAEGDGEDLKAVLKKTAPNLDAYAFEVKSGPGTGPGTTVVGKFQKGQPLFCQADGIDFFRNGEVMVYRQGEQWMRTRKGRESDPLRILGASAAVHRVRPPHEELPVVVKGLTEVKKSNEKDVVVYTGDLDARTARQLAPTEVREITRGGSAQVWTDKGEVVKYAYTLNVKGRLGNADVDGTRTKTVELKGLGKTKVEVPAAARKALE